METELKLRILDQVRPRDLEHLDWSPYQLGPRQRHKLRDTVLDSSDRAITASRHALRVRRDGRLVYLTLKGPPGTSGGSRHKRDEWEELIALDAAGDRRLWPAEIATRVEALIGDQPLEPLVEVENKRRTWDILHAGAIIAELALDQGTIRANGRAMPLHEIEVEVKADGAEPHLEAIEQRLKQALRLADQPQTKLARGLQLLVLDEVESASDAAPKITMEGEASLAEASRTILRQHWKKLRDNEPGVRAGDPEAVHDMRVATRRLRAMMDVLSGIAFDPDEIARLRKGLKQLAAALGVVRDAEVWLASVDDYSAKLPEPEQAGLDPLRQRLNTMRDVGREDLFATLANKRMVRLLDQLETFVTTPGAGLAEFDHFAPRVRDAAGSALWSQLEAVHAFEVVMPEAPLLLLHELRIACKKLRYTIELFEDALPDDAANMHEELVAAQDHLGSLHDADVALPFIDEFLEMEPHNLALSHYRSHLEHTRDRLWSSVPEVWSRIGSNKFRKRLAKLVAAL